MLEPDALPASCSVTVINKGAVLDRNGLAPQPLLHHEGRPPDFCPARSAVLDLPAEEIVRKDRPRPGKMLLFGRYHQGE